MSKWYRTDSVSNGFKLFSSTFKNQKKNFMLEIMKCSCLALHIFHVRINASKPYSFHIFTFIYVSFYTFFIETSMITFTFTLHKARYLHLAVLEINSLKSAQIRCFFWSVFSCIPTEYGNLRSESLYSIQMQ